MPLRTPTALTLLLLTSACVIRDDTDTTDTSDTSDTGTTDVATGTSEPATETTYVPTTSLTETTNASSSGGPDPDYVRECQQGDFVCDDWGCEDPPEVVPNGCYKRCTPTVVGEPDAECDEPERPFCSQVGRALGGDFNCNGCAHICVSAAINHCDQAIATCE